ncbi:MAG: hypothetical protein ACLFPE_09000 [Bacteroidales bacterium]
MRYLIYISLLVAVVFAHPRMMAQQEKDVGFEEIDTILNKVILRKEIMGGAMLHTAGWGLLFRKGYNVNAFTKNLWEAELMGVKDPKEVRVNFYGAYYSNANSYIYGKLNKVYVFHGGLGQQRLLNSKPYWGGVELRLTYYGGISIGIAKPMYLYIINQNNFALIESERYNPDKHFIEDIYGRAPFLDGIQHTKFHPGLYLKGGLNFEFGQYNTSIKALEVGVIADGFAIPIPIMAFRDKNYFFLNFYLNFTFGKRYNKF